MSCLQVPIPRSLVFKLRPQRTHISRFRFWRYCMIVSILLLSLLRSHGLQIHLSSKSPKFAAVGDTAQRSCHFNLHPKDSGVLDIEWSIKPCQTLVIWYSGDRIYDNYNPFGRRVCFVSPDPASGNASINISNLKMTDTNTYQCKVRKGPAAIKSRIIHLNAIKRPAKLECYAEDAVELNRKLAFRCRAAKGSPPIWYSWSMNGTRRLPHDATFDPTRGDLVLTISKEILSSGTLVCTAHNPVGMKTCLVALRLNSTDVKEERKGIMEMRSQRVNRLPENGCPKRVTGLCLQALPHVQDRNSRSRCRGTENKRTQMLQITHSTWK
uniref:coxsackievirus and adenovirus receptor homolog isoform X3 n=1 Tax=Scatophagus argus TaxID=75038 RepID=UPI001ED7D1A1|nr:coxsackievirus and adenovirus receptor homolog isoform X3 [Scatophagus argus]